jgi:hypothetical protein
VGPYPPCTQTSTASTGIFEGGVGNPASSVNVYWLAATPMTNCFLSSNGQKKMPLTTWLGRKLTISSAKHRRRRKRSHVSASTSHTTQMSYHPKTSNNFGGIMWLIQLLKLHSQNVLIT